VKITSIIAIYFLFFCFAAFVLLPFSYRRAIRREDEKLVPGQAESAPSHFDARRHLVISALIAVGLFALYYANYSEGWVKVQDLDYFDPPEAGDNFIG
jgi:predicted secreted protein